MKLALILLSFLFLPNFSPQAQAYSPREVAQTYRTCQSILKQSPAKQTELARRAGVTRAVLVDNCRIFVKKGIKRNVELEKEYQDWAHGRGKFAPRRDRGEPQCYSQSGCLAHQQCLGGFCQSRSSSTCDNGARSCGLYQRCVNGSCQ